MKSIKRVSVITAMILLIGLSFFIEDASAGGPPNLFRIRVENGEFYPECVPYPRDCLDEVIIR